MSPVSGVAVDAMALCEVDFSKFVGVIRSAVIHRSFGGLSFRYIFVLFGMGDFGSISFNGTIDLWDPLILLSGITGIGTTVCAWWIARVGTWQNDSLRAMMEWPYAVVHTDWSLWFTLWCYVVLCAWLMPFCRSYARRVQFGLMSVILTLCAFAVNRQFCRIRPESCFIITLHVRLST